MNSGVDKMNCDGFTGWCQVVTLPENPYLLASLVFLSVVVGIRIVRWVLDVLP